MRPFNPLTMSLPRLTPYYIPSSLTEIQAHSLLAYYLHAVAQYKKEGGSPKRFVNRFLGRTHGQR